MEQQEFWDTPPRPPHPLPRPFLKWVGGKGQLLDALMERVDRAGPFARYHEPFLGGGALFFELARRQRLGSKQAYLSDHNPVLIETWLTVRDEVDTLIGLLQTHRTAHCKDHFYRVREEVPDSSVERAARIIYLNKTCFNGLYRENSKGRFNVPMGRYKKPLICDEANLRAAAEALRGTRIEYRPFQSVLEHARPGDFVYCDPPYVPLSATSNFTSYARNGFGIGAQHQLAEVFAELDAKGVRVLLSNSAAPVVRDLYAGFIYEEVAATRAVNSKADRRGTISEALVRNFE
jgi:DNA adenine methylase